jgi:PIN domain nuclease of toxin-antitoxin system
MIYLLDTHILIWSIFNSEKLSKKVDEILLNSDNLIFVSAINFWEISLKFQSGKLNLGKYNPIELESICQNMGFENIQLNTNDTKSVFRLNAEYHKDPFDRMLIWQAIKNDYILISDDENVKKYVSEGLKVVY